MAMEPLISPVGTVIMYVGNIANIAVGRLHAYKAENRHLLAAELGNRLGESLYMLQHGLSSSIALVGLYNYNAVLSA